MIEYILRSLNTTADTTAVIEGLYTILPSELGETMPTVAEQLFRKGEIEGEIRGKIEGIEKTLTAVSLIEEGKDNVTIAQETGLDLEIIEKFRRKITH